MSGTSMASPHVAAAAAVLKSANPSASALQVITALKQSGKTVTDWATNQAFPRIDVGAAVKLIANMSGASELGATVTINGGKANAASPNVKLAIAPATGISTSGLTMCISNGADCANFVPFAASANWVLDYATNGPKTVSVWLKSAAGAKSAVPASATVAFAMGADTTAPTDVATVTAAVDASLTSMTLTWDPTTASDDVTGVKNFIVVYKAGSYPPVKCVSGKKGVMAATVPAGADVSSVTVTGLKSRRTYRFRVCAVDYAGNVSNGATGFASTKKRRASRRAML
jgi:subtilisin family serine protease